MHIPFRGTLATLALSLFLLPAAAQTAPKPGPLTQEQKLQIENYAKDVKLAQQQIELLKVQMAGAMLSERESAQAFKNYIDKLRRQLHAPADKWDFDGSTLSFIPKGSKSTAAAPAKTSKPASTASGSGGGR